VPLLDKDNKTKLKKKTKITVRDERIKAIRTA